MGSRLSPFSSHSTRQKMKYFAVLLVVASCFALTAARSPKPGKKCEKLTERFEACLVEGFVSEKFSNCPSSKKAISDKMQKRCQKVDDKLDKFVNRCGDPCN